MRRTLGTLAIALFLLVGCGDDGRDPVDDRAEDPAPSQSSEPTDPATEPPSGVDVEVVALVSASAAGGEVSTEAESVSDEGDLAEFLGRFSSPELQADVRRAVTAYRLPPGRELVAATVSIGCDVPPGVAVTRSGDDYDVTAKKVADPLPECFAPVTTVAVVAVPAD